MVRGKDVVMRAVFVLLCLPLWCLATEDSLDQAQNLVMAGQFEQAAQMYQRLGQSQSNPRDKLLVRQGLASCYYFTGQSALARSTWQPLVQTFNRNSLLPGVLREIAGSARDVECYEDAIQLYQISLEQSPRNNNALRSQAGLVVCYACQGQSSAMSQAFQVFEDSYRQYPDFRTVALDIGDQLRWRSLDSALACRAYQLAVADPTYPEQIWALQGLAICAVQEKEDAVVTEAVEILLNQFPGNEHLGQILCHIADAYRDTRQPLEAESLYRYVIDSIPESNHAVWCQVGLAIAAQSQKDQTKVDEAIKTLCETYTPDATWASAVGTVADYCRWGEDYTRARDLYAMAVAVDSQHSKQLQFEMGLAICQICTDQREEARMTLEQLGRFNNDVSELPQAIYEIAATYNNAGQYDQANLLFHRVMANWPESDFAVRSQAGLALVAARQGDEETVEQVYQRMIEASPDHPLVSESLFLLGEDYYDRALESDDETLKKGNSWIRCFLFGSP